MTTDRDMTVLTDMIRIAGRDRAAAGEECKIKNSKTECMTHARVNPASFIHIYDDGIFELFHQLPSWFVTM